AGRAANDHERIADEIAAETLVPADDFTARWNSHPGDVEQRLARLRAHYKVSVFVLLRRAYDTGQLSTDEFHRYYDLLRSQIIPKKGGGGGGYSTFFSRNSQKVS